METTSAPADVLRSFEDIVRAAGRDVLAHPHPHAERQAAGAAGPGSAAGPGDRQAEAGGARRVGIEIESFVVDVTRPQRSVPPEETAAALAAAAGVTTGTGSETEGRLPGGSRLTFEPGGQLELSGPPLPLTEAVGAMRGDLQIVREELARAGLGVAGFGVDPLRPPRRHSTAARYVAMDRHFRTCGGEAGLTMMCSTASVQVNLDGGSGDEDIVARFRLAHALEPVLIAMFAASPVGAGQRLGWQSGRQAVWAGIDASRTGPVLPDLADLADLAAGPEQLAVLWARYLHDATLMMVGHDDGRYQAVERPTTFGAWLAGAGPVRRPPTVQDLGWHATTLFPPVRPRGWLELRYLDAQPSGLWPVAVAVPTVLLDDPDAARGALAACLPVAGRGEAAARRGLRDPELFRAAARCIDLAVAALGRAGGDPELRAAVEAFADRYTRRRRSPADDLSARFAARGPTELLREEAARCVPVP
ncbi:ergothioneine biosynthesis glutamate--cysteine ligase EgtA [Parafrankia sp. FMc2]